MNRTILVLAALAAPATAAACGGLFCDSNQPITQAAERILFAVRDGQTEMHVRLTYAGPPSEFGWLLPVPADVTTSLSDDGLFDVLDRLYAPQFQLRREGVGCDGGFGGEGGVGGSGGGMGGAGGGDRPGTSARCGSPSAGSAPPCPSARRPSRPTRTWA